MDGTHRTVVILDKRDEAAQVVAAAQIHLSPEDKPVKRPMEYKDAEDHIMGRATYGIYLLRADSAVMTGVLDVDLVQKYRLPKLPAADVALVRRERNFLIRRIHEISIDAGMRAILEFSGGKGFHFWYCFASPAPAAVARQALEQIRRGVSGTLGSILAAFKTPSHLVPFGFCLSEPIFQHLMILSRSSQKLFFKRFHFPNDTIQILCDQSHRHKKKRSCKGYFAATESLVCPRPAQHIRCFRLCRPFLFHTPV